MVDIESLRRDSITHRAFRLCAFRQHECDVCGYVSDIHVRLCRDGIRRCKMCNLNVAACIKAYGKDFPIGEA